MIILRKLTNHDKETIINKSGENYGDDVLFVDVVVTVLRHA